MSLATHVVRRGAVYYFRARVPGNLRAAVGRNELWRSLRTSQACEARRRAVTVSGLAEALWRDLGTAMKHPMTASDKDIIKALVDGWLRAEIEEDAELRSGSKSTTFPGVVLRQQPPWQPDEVVRYLDHDEVSAVQRATPDRRDKLLGPNCYMVENISPFELSRSRQRKIFDDVAGRHAAGDESIASEHVKALLARHGLPIDEFSSSFEIASKMMMRAHHDLLLAMRDRDAIGWRPNLDEDPAEALLQKLTRSAIASSAAPVPTPLSGMTLGDSCEKYVSESLKNEAFKPGRADEVRSAVKNFVDWFERSPDLSEITPQVAGDYRIDMSFYPVSGAKTVAGNGQLAHRYCNASKNATIPPGFAEAD